MQSKSETRLWLVLIFTLCGVMVWVRTSTVKVTYQYVQNQKELRGIDNKLQDLRIRWLKLTSPKRLEAQAAKLDLVPAVPSQYVRYTPKGNLN